MAETLIYKWIREKPRYGTELINLTKQTISQNIKTPTIYAILNRGRDQGLLIDFEREDKDKITRGKERKYYKLSREGEEYYDQLRLYLENATYLHDFIGGYNLKKIQGESALENNTWSSTDLYAGKLIYSKLQLSKTDLVVIGYLALFGTTTISIINTDTSLNSEEIKTSIDKLSSEFDIESNKANSLETQFSIELKGKQAKFHRFLFSEIDKNVINKVAELNFDDIQIMKLLSGLLIILREIRSLSWLIQYIRSNEIPILANLSKEMILTYLCIMSLDRGLSIQVTTEGWVLVNKTEKTKIHDDWSFIPNYQWVNFHEIVGWISQNRMFRINDLREKIIEGQEIQIGNNEVFLILSALVCNSIVEGSFSEDMIFYTYSINKSEIQYFTSDERVIIGLLKSVKSPKLQNIANVLSKSTGEVQQILDHLISTSNFSYEISRNGNIFTNDLPKIPLQIQNNLLTKELQIVLGYLTEGQTVNLSSLETVLGLYKDQIKQFIFKLVGYGLIHGNMTDNKFKIVSKNPSKPLESDISESQTKLALQIEQFGESFNVSELSNELMSKTEWYHELSILITIGVYPNAHFDGEHFHKNGKAQLKPSSLPCNSCGRGLSLDEDICSQCGQKRWYCIVCRGLIDSIQNSVACPSCAQRGHNNHFSAWLEVKSECPSCRSNIEINQLVVENE